jgi:LacI family transcriptional regulator
VSFTFRRPDRVRNSTREAVLAAARALGYLPSASARGLADGRTGALGLYSFDYLLDGAHHDQAVGVPAVDTDAGASASHDDPNEGFRLFPLYVDEVQRGVVLECWRRGYALMIGGAVMSAERQSSPTSRVGWMAGPRQSRSVGL